MATLINTTNPYLRILVDPVQLRFRQFEGGKLVVEKDDPDRELLMAEAQRNPAIRVVETAVWCPECGTPFAGAMAKAELGRHRKEFHLEAYFNDQEASLAREKNAIIVERSGIPCPICRSTERFPDAETLAVHTQVIHGTDDAEPALDVEGNTLGGVDRPDGSAPAAPASIPPAAPAGG